MMKSLLTILLALVGCLGLLSACSDEVKESDDPVCGLPATVDITAPIIGTACYDSVAKSVVIEIEPTSLTDPGTQSFWLTSDGTKYDCARLRPFPDSPFCKDNALNDLIIPGQRLIVKCGVYSHPTEVINGVLYHNVSLKDVCPISQDAEAQ
ncbi:MAG: hypothetical protein HFJ93_02040 [Muribaculaceae bacterium]|jgi:hypothetical protein|nr:hypothetical protein [Muribaculaceae bacterium]